MDTQVPTEDIVTSSQDKRKTEYVYKNVKGEVEGRVIRTDKDGEKDFLPQRLENGNYKNGLNGGKLPLYGIEHFPENPKRAIFWVEGEKCVDYIRGHKGVAVTSAGGSKGFQSWLAKRGGDLNIFRGRRVIVLADNDEPGKQYAKEVADALLDAGAVPMVIPRCPWTEEGEDVADWLHRGHKLAELVPMAVKYTKEALVPNMEEMGIETKPIEWLWKDRIPLGFLTMIFGDGGCGKSFMLTDIMSRITRGDNYPDGEPAPKGSVMLLDKEQHASDIKMKFEAANADMTKVIYLHTVPSGYEPSLQKIEEIEEVIKSVHDLKMIVIDPITDFTGSADINSETDVRKVLTPLKELAEVYNIAIVFVRHNNKSATSAKNKVGGSTAWTNVVRFSWMVSQDGNISTMSIAKTNFGKPPAFNFTFDEDDKGRAKTKWLDQVNLTADQILEAELSDNKLEIKEAANWLRAVLQNGDETSEKIFTKGSKNGYTKSALRKAMAQLGVETYLVGDVEWRKLNAEFGSSAGWTL